MPRRSFKDYLNKSADEVDTPVVYASDPAIRDEDRERLMDMERVSKENAQAKESGTLVGRIVYPPFREGWGHMYQITEEDKKGVVVVHICGSYPLPRWGERSWIQKTGLCLPDDNDRDGYRQRALRIASKKVRGLSTTELFAKPSTPDVRGNGFTFDSFKDYHEKAEGVTDSLGNPVEAFEIEFIEGEDIDWEMFVALEVTQATLELYFRRVKRWNEEEKIRVIVATICGHTIKRNSKPNDFEVDIYEVDSLQDLARSFVKEGLFGDIPRHVWQFLDVDALARALRRDFHTLRIAAKRIVYRRR